MCGSGNWAGGGMVPVRVGQISLRATLGRCPPPPPFAINTSMASRLGTQTSCSIPTSPSSARLSIWDRAAAAWTWVPRPSASPVSISGRPQWATAPTISATSPWTSPKVCPTAPAAPGTCRRSHSPGRRKTRHRCPRRWCSCGAIGFVMPTPLPKSGQKLLYWLVLGPKVA